MMTPPLSSLYTLSFAIAVVATLFVAATLRLLTILPGGSTRGQQWRKRPQATRVLIVLGSGGHTHEMFYLLRDLDTSKYTHRTYVVSSGDAFSAQKAVQFEKELEEKVSAKLKEQQQDANGAKSKKRHDEVDQNVARKMQRDKTFYVGPNHYNVAVVPRARKIHQPLLTTPVSAFHCLWSCFAPLLAVPVLSKTTSTSSLEPAANDVPDLIITNGPATAVIVILASLILRFFNVKGANSESKCKTIYAESFARVNSLSLSGKILSRVVDRFLVQWEELEGAGGGRAEFWGILV